MGQPTDRRKVLVARVELGDPALMKPYADIARATTTLLKRYDAGELRTIADYLNAERPHGHRSHFRGLPPLTRCPPRLPKRGQGYATEAVHGSGRNRHHLGAGRPNTQTAHRVCQL